MPSGKYKNYLTLKLGLYISETKGKFSTNFEKSLITSFSSLLILFEEILILSNDSFFISKKNSAAKVVRIKLKLVIIIQYKIVQ
jgi:hypothetical protein